MITRAVILWSGLLCIAAVASDEKPNFTGVWRLGEGTNTTVDNVEHQEPNLKVTFQSHFTAGSLGSSLSGDVSYTTDGVERTSTSGNGRLGWITAHWQGPSLVILRVTKDSYRVSVARETWTLSQDGRALTKNRRTINMDGVTESTQVFQKQ